MPGEVLDQGIDDLHKPMDHVQGQPGCDSLPVFLGDLIDIDIKRQGQQRYHIPLERVAGSQYGKGHGSSFRVIHANLLLLQDEHMISMFSHSGKRPEEKEILSRLRMQSSD
jgi:hypothetical protein